MDNINQILKEYYIDKRHTKLKISFQCNFVRHGQRY